MKAYVRILSVILAVVLVFSMTSCSLISEDTTDITNDHIKIGVILSDSKDAECGMSAACVKSIRSVTDLGYGIDEDRFKYVENVDPNDSDAVAKVLKSLINFECSLIIVADPAYYDDIENVADQNPSVKFLVLNSDGNGKNIIAYNDDITDAVYLTGIVAAMKADALSVPQIGFLAKSEENLKVRDAFLNGVAKVNPNIKVTTSFGTDAGAAAKELITNGCVVLASDYEDKAIADTAAENNVFFCGFGTENLSNDYQESFLCAPIYDFTQFYINTIKAIVDDTETKNLSGDLSTGAAYLSSLNSKTVADGTKEAVDAAAESFYAAK